MRLNLRLALMLLIALVAVGGVWSGLNSPQSSDNSSATVGPLKSATLVVDFGSDSGRETKVIQLADLPNAATGWDLLVRADVAVQGTDQYPTGFVCRIDGWPTEQAEACDETPAYSDGHWAYFVTSKKLGGGWLLSGQGAATHVVECGGFEGWKWVGPNDDSTPPRVSPEVGDC
jgi:hypothetical protein